MMIVFSLASWNGATYYIDVFGRRMEKELDQLRKEVARMSKSPDISGQDGMSVTSPFASPSGPTGLDSTSAAATTALDLGPAADTMTRNIDGKGSLHQRGKSTDTIPPFDSATESVQSVDYDETPAPTPGLELNRTIDGGLASNSDLASHKVAMTNGKAHEPVDKKSE